MRQVRIRRPDDFHVHLRRGMLMEKVLPYTARSFARALVMPNTDPPIINAYDVNRYYGEICETVASNNFHPLMTFKITPATTPDMVDEIAQYGTAIAGKLYPDNVTTNSAGGVRDFKALYPVFERMQEHNLVLCLHGEHPDAFCLDREAQFLKILWEISNDFVELRIVLEHISTKEAVISIGALHDRVAATITVHHLFLTLDDVIGGALKPHYFCKPIAKRPEDREAVVQAALSGSPKFFLGTDSAPHVRGNKECAEGCAGIYTAPVALPLLAEFFENHERLSKLEAFTSEYGARFYGLPPNEGTITLKKRPFHVRPHYAGIVPFRAGESLPWSVV